MLIEFTILVEPKSVQHGARAGIRKGKIRFYNDAEKKAYQTRIILEAKHHAPRKPMEGPLAVRYEFFLNKPKGTRFYLPIGKPDVGNIEKHTTDALSHCGFWNNDSQIVTLLAEKRYAEAGNPPRIRVTIKTLL